MAHHSPVTEERRTRISRILPYPCDLCSKSYALAKHLWGHVSTAHKGDPRVTCGICVRTLTSVARLNLHMKLKHMELTIANISEEIGKMRLQVESEEESPSNNKKSSKPKRIEEPGNKPDETDDEKGDISYITQKLHSCVLCSKFEGNQNIGLMHHYGCDEKVNDYRTTALIRCELCTGETKELDGHIGFWLHMIKTHPNEVPKTCAICRKRYDDRESLSRHIKKYHPSRERYWYSCCNPGIMSMWPPASSS